MICAMELSSATYRVTLLYLTLRRRVMWSAHCARNPLVKTIHSSVISESFILKLRLTRRRLRPRLKPRRRKARRKGSSQNFVIVVERHLSPLGPLWAIRKRFTSWSLTVTRKYHFVVSCPFFQQKRFSTYFQILLSGFRPMGYVLLFIEWKVPFLTAKCEYNLYLNLFGRRGS